VAGYKARWFTRPQMVTHPSTNRARRRVTSLIETNALQVSQAATMIHRTFVDRLLHLVGQQRSMKRTGPSVSVHL